MRKIDWNLLNFPQVIKLTPEEESGLGLYEINKLNDKINIARCQIDDLNKEIDRIKFYFKRDKKGKNKNGS